MGIREDIVRDYGPPQNQTGAPVASTGVVLGELREEKEAKIQEKYGISPGTVWMSLYDKVKTERLKKEKNLKKFGDQIKEKYHLPNLGSVPSANRKAWLRDTQKYFSMQSQIETLKEKGAELYRKSIETTRAYDPGERLDLRIKALEARRKYDEFRITGKGDSRKAREKWEEADRVAYPGKWFDKDVSKYYEEKIEPIIMPLATAVMVLYGGHYAIKSGRDYYNYVRLGKSIIKLSKPEKQKLVREIVAVNIKGGGIEAYPKKYTEIPEALRGKYLKGEPIKIIKTRRIFQKLESVFKSTKVADVADEPKGLLYAFGGGPPAKQIGKALEKIPPIKPEAIPGVVAGVTAKFAGYLGGDKSMPTYHIFGSDKYEEGSTVLKEQVIRAGAKIVPGGKPLPGMISKPSGTVKARIHRVTGVQKVGELLELRDDKALRHLIRREKKAAQEGYKFGLGKGKVISQERIGQYKTKLEAAKSDEERRNLVIKLRAEQKASKEGYRFGVKEIRQILKDRREVVSLLKSLKSLDKAKLSDDYRAKLNELFSGYDFARRAPKTLAQRVGTKEYIEKLPEGELFIPADVLKTAHKKPLNDMDIDELRDVQDKAKTIVHLGRLKGKLISGKQIRDHKQTVSNLILNIRRSFVKPKHKDIIIKDPKTGQPKIKVLTPSERKGIGLGARKKAMADKLDRYFAVHKKGEAIIESLDGYEPLGVVHKTIFQKIKRAEDAELIRNHKIHDKITDILKDSKIDFKKAYDKQDEIMGSRLTKVEQMAVYANSRNPDNRLRLMVGYGWYDEKIDAITANLKPNEKRFVDKVMTLVGDQWKELEPVGKKLMGRTPEEVNFYWPIVTDRELSDQKLLHEREKNLFQDIIRKAYVKRGFMMARKGGTDPINLDFFKVLTDHLNRTNHFITHALPVRDNQKILYDPNIKHAIVNAVGIPEYTQLKGWLNHVASPKQTPFNVWDRVAASLRHKSTMAMLGLKVSVSLKQAGSFSQTINRIGAKDSVVGLYAFYKNPIKVKDFIYKNSPAMKYRKENFDRELRDYIRKEIGVKKGWDLKKHKFFFELISTVDRLTTLPSWTAAYIKANKLYNGNKEKMVDYADMIVRRTQPTASPKDMAAIQRGGEFQKLFTMFYTHFSNAYNETARIHGMVKQKKITKGDALVGYWWTVIGPALFAGIISGSILRKKGVKGKTVAAGKAIIGYGTASFPIIGNLITALMSKFPYTATPVEALPRETIKAVRGKKPIPRIKAGARAAGYLLGLPTPQLVITAEGANDLLTGETGNPMRLFLSKYQLGETKKEKTRYIKTKTKSGVGMEDVPIKDISIRDVIIQDYGER